MQNDSDYVAGGKPDGAVASPLTGSMPSAGEYLEREMQFGADMVSKYSKVCQELATIKRVAACGTVTSFLALSDDEKRYWFALAIEESDRRKTLEQRVLELEAAQLDSIPELRNILRVTMTSEFSVGLLLRSCRSAEAFKNAINKAVVARTTNEN